MGLGLVVVREFFLKPTQKKDRPRYRVTDPFNFKSSLVLQIKFSSLRPLA